MEKPSTNSKRVLVKYVAFNGPVSLISYHGFVNVIDTERKGPDGQPYVLVNSVVKKPLVDIPYVEGGLLHVGEDKFPLNGGRVIQFR
jgi:hypothetical protein